MKKILATVLFIISIGSYAETQRVEEYMDQIGFEMLAKVSAEEMTIVDIIKVNEDGNLKEDTTGISVNSLDFSCTAELSFENSGLGFDFACENGEGCSCETKEKTEFENANIAVNMTIAEENLSNGETVTVNLFAVDKISKTRYVIHSEEYTNPRTLFASDNYELYKNITVVFIVPHYFTEKFNFETVVTVNNASGVGCADALEI